MANPPEVLPQPRPGLKPGEPTKIMVGALAEAAAKNPEAQPRPVRSRKNKDVAAEKRKAEEVIAKLKQGILPKGETPQTPEIQEQILRTQLAEGQAKNIIKKVEDIPDDPTMLNTLADILTAPPELQNNPRWLLAKGAEIRQAIRADMPIDQQLGARNVLKQIYQRIEDIEDVDMGNVGVRTSRDPAVREKVQFVELAGNSLLPEAGVMPAPAREPTAVDKIFTGPDDELAGAPFAEELEKLKYELITDPDPNRHDTHHLAQVQREIAKVGRERAGYDSPEVLEQVKEAKRRIQAVIDESAAAQQARMPLRGRDVSSAFKPDNPDWIYDKDERGNKILPEDEKDASGKVVRSLKPVRDALEQLEGTWHVNDPVGIEAQAKILEDVVNDPKNRITDHDIRPYYNKLKDHYKVLIGDRWRPTAEEMDLIRNDWRERDKIFFHRINNVLQNQFEQSRQVMNLYKEAGVDIFIDAVREAMGPDGDKWASHYEHLKQSIFFNHDVEQIARSAQGDVEVLQKLVHISHTSYMLEATQDPIVEAMAASLEQALIQILQDHDGHLPPDLFSLRDGKVYWNELAMQIFKTKVESGVVRDYMRNADGSPVPKDNHIGYKLGEVFKIEELESQKLRIAATLQLAKGVGVFDHRLLELFASAKTPGFETRDTAFSSIPYEGIARFFRPIAHLFGKYHMGELAHKAVFATLIGGRMPDVVNFVKWSPDDYIHVSEAVAEGTLSVWLKKKYGEKLGAKLFTEVTPFIEIMSDTMWSGRVGPHSTWGEHDATLNFTDLQRELEGGSIRLGRAQWWASRAVQGEYYATHPPEDWSKWNDLQHTPAFKEKIKNLKKAYSTWVWAQMTLRNPKAVAENVFMTPNGIQLENKKGIKLRTQLIEEILHINLARDVSTEATPNQSQRNNMARIAILEADLATVQHAALYGGPNGEPREIREEDYAILNGDKKVRGTDEVVSQKIRREQAELYIKEVRERVLGSKWKTEEDVKRALGITVSPMIVPDNAGKNTYTLNDMLHFGNVNKIDDIVGDGDKKIGEIQRNGGRLTHELIAREQGIYMNQADTRKGDLDIGNLGERAYARLTNDLLNRKEAISIMQELLGEFGPKMDEKTVLTLIKKMYIAEKAGRGPDDSAKAFVYYYARLYGEFYRGHWAGKLPFLGQILRRVGPWDLSVAQSVYNKKTGDVWSINNENDWIDKIDKLGILPYHEVEPNGKINKYSIQRMQRELVGGNKAAAVEMVFIAAFIAAGLTVVAASAKSREDTSD